MSNTKPLTDEQRNAIPSLRAAFSGGPPSGTTQSLEERARQPESGSLPADATVRIEIAPPSQHPHPLLDSTGALKTPERVPVYFYTLHDVQHAAEPELDVADTLVIFDVHGGGNVVGHPTEAPFVNFYVEILRAIAARSGGARKCVLVAPSYRLATVPENSFPAALQDLVAAYDHVLSKGYKASNTVILGDSAGGNNALVLTHLILQSDRSPPRGAVSIAPFQMHDHFSEFAKAQAAADTMDISVFMPLTLAYIGDSGVARTDPLMSAAFIPFTESWPKTLILVGTADQLIDVSREVEKRLVAKNRPVELVEYVGRPHGWWVVPQVFPDDIQDAAQRIARFVLD